MAHMYHEFMLWYGRDSHGGWVVCTMALMVYINLRTGFFTLWLVKLYLLFTWYLPAGISILRRNAARRRLIRDNPNCIYKNRKG